MGYPGLEPETSPLSGARSTTELIARALALEPQKNLSFVTTNLLQCITTK